MQPYNDLFYKNTMRPAYAFTKVSPDYTILEFQVGDRKAPRTVRVSLTDGSILGDDVKIPESNTPMLLLDAAHLPKSGGAWGEAFVPSIDPVREPGSFRIDTIEEAFPKEAAPKKRDPFEIGEVQLLTDGLTKADTPSWMKATGKKPEEAARLIFTDLEAGMLYTLFPGNERTELQLGATRGRIINGNSV